MVKYSKKEHIILDILDLVVNIRCAVRDKDTLEFWEDLVKQDCESSESKLRHLLLMVKEETNQT